MFDHFAYFMTYARAYAQYMLRVRGTLAFLLLLISLGGVVVSKVEDIKLGDGMYFAFVTGLTIGYGDITPQTTTGRIVSVIIGVVGVLFVGLTVAIATRALRDTMKHLHESES
jgi:hypothetical protein